MLTLAACGHWQQVWGLLICIARPEVSAKCNPEINMQPAMQLTSDVHGQIEHPLGCCRMTAGLLQCQDYFLLLLKLHWNAFSSIVEQNQM